jgi:putative transcriptional regulator
MKTVRMKIDVLNPTGKSSGRIDHQRGGATTEAEIARHKAADDADTMLDAAKFARRVRRRLGFSQAEFAERIDVSLDTIRNWEQGKRSPTGAAKALLKILDKAPEAALAALH